MKVSQYDAINSLAANDCLYVIQDAGGGVYNSKRIAVSDLGALTLLDTVGTNQIDNDAVTYAKLQNLTTARLLGRSTAGTGNCEEITIGTGLSLAAGTLTATGGGGTPGGSTTQVQYNNGGAFAGDAGMTYNAGTDTLTVVALTVSNVELTGFLEFGNSFIDATGGIRMKPDTDLALTFESSSGGAKFKIDNNGIGFFGATPTGQGLVSNPSGGGTQDGEARASIDQIIALLNNLGLLAGA